MHQASPAGQSGNLGQQQNVEEERKKLDADLKAGKISQAEYFKKMQELTGSSSPGAMPQGQAPVPAGAPQLPPAGGSVVPMPPMGTGQAPIKPASPITPVSPTAPQTSEEVPPIGQALAVGSEDVEVVECYKCGGLITVTTKQRPVIIACPTCGIKGEVDASEPEIEPEQELAPKPTDAKELDDSKVFKFAGDEHAETPKAPTFGASLDEDLAKQDQTTNQSAPASTPTPNPTTNTQPSTPTPNLQSNDTTDTEQPRTLKPQLKKTE